MATTFTLSGINPYVDEHNDELLLGATLGAKSIDRFSIQNGVKGKTSINILDTEVTFADGSYCGFSPDGSITVSKRYIEPVILKNDKEWCPLDLLGYEEQHLIKVGAGKESNPWESKFTADLNDKVNTEVERLIWQGDSSETGEFDGLVTILAYEGATTTDIIVDVTSADTVWDKVTAVYAAVPARVKKNTTIYVDPDTFTALVQELTASNLYHYVYNDATGQIKLPGTNCAVLEREGLAGADYNIVALQDEFVKVGVDTKGDENAWRIWYSEDNGTYRWQVRFAMGVQTAFPAYCRIAATNPSPAPTEAPTNAPG